MSLGIIASHEAGSSSLYDSLILAKSPGFYWKMDEPSFANGQSLIDSTGNGRSLVVNGSGLSAQGSLLTSGVGGSLAMDGTSGTYGVLTSTSWMNQTSFTLTYLVYMRTGDSWQIHRWGDASPTQRCWVSVAAGWFSAYVSGSQRDAYLTSVANGKHHIAHRLSYNGSTTTQTVFVDGTAVASRTDSGAVNTNATNLLVGRDTASSYSPCRLSRVAYFGSALSDADITSFAAAA